MNVAVVGSSGYIAGYLIKHLLNEEKVHKILRIDRMNEDNAFLDLGRAQDFDYDRLEDMDYVIFTAAVSGPDQCADKFEESWDVNVTGTSYFIRHAIKCGCRVLFFSSDAVFGDRPEMIYTEESVTKAKTPYGRMKKAVEDRFKGNFAFKAIRLSYVVSARDRFVSYCLECISNGKTADIFHPFYRNCIVVSDVVQTVSWIISHWDEYKPQFLNVAGAELVSRVRIADEVNRLCGNRLNYVITRPDETFYQNRPAITQMTSLYLQEYGILPDETFTEKIKKELRGIKNEH